MQMKNKLLIIIAVILPLSLSLNAQNVTDLMISEVMADNDSSIVDNYGQRNGWIEVFNRSQGTVSYGGCYFSDDRSNLKKSFIPKGDLRTQLGPRQVVVFYASGNSKQGTFYVDFKVRKGTTIYLTSNDGRTVVDSMAIPANLPANMTVSKYAHDFRSMDFKTDPNPTQPSPMVINGNGYTETKSQVISRKDPYGLILTLVSVSVVFIALIILWFLYGTSGDAFQGKFKRKKKNKEMTPEIAAAISMALAKEMGGEEYAAIAMALHQYLNDTVHDMESFVITIKPSNSVARHFNFRQLPK
jgi:Na+-transporting methylmalonyl-CoA/oxaloacetate decarboxylase gamma subunit